MNFLHRSSELSLARAVYGGMTARRANGRESAHYVDEDDDDDDDGDDDDVRTHLLIKPAGRKYSSNVKPGLTTIARCVSARSQLRLRSPRLAGEIPI